MKLTYEYKGETHTLDIKDYELNPMKQRFLKAVNNDDEIMNVLYDILKELNTSRLCSEMQIINTKYPNYQEKLSLFKFYAKKLKDQFKYNEIVNELIQQHIKNLDFDEIFVKEHADKVAKPKTKATKKKLPLWIRQQSTDLFDGQIMYIYTNTKTNEIIKSHNPNLIEEELSVKKKKKLKESKVISGKIIFSFK